MTKRLIGRVAIGLIFGFLFSIAAQLFILMPAVAGVVWLALIAVSFLWIHLRGVEPGRATRVAALVRLRPVRVGTGWLLGLAGAMMVFGLGIGGVLHIWLGPVQLDTRLAEPIMAYLRSPGGPLVLVLYVVTVGPMIEEISFRGWVQRPLERRLGPTAAILITAFLFATMHYGRGHALLMLIPFGMGLVWGTAVYATGSIWTGVAMHATWNLSMIVLAHVSPGRPSLMDWSQPVVGPVLAVAMIVLGGALVLRLAAQARRQGRTAVLDVQVAGRDSRRMRRDQYT